MSATLLGLLFVQTTENIPQPIHRSVQRPDSPKISKPIVIIA
jgi:hypothetical protein